MLQRERCVGYRAHLTSVLHAKRERQLGTVQSVVTSSQLKHRCAVGCYLFPISLCLRNWMLLALSASSGYCSTESM